MRESGPSRITDRHAVEWVHRRGGTCLNATAVRDERVAGRDPEIDAVGEVRDRPVADGEPLLTEAEALDPGSDPTSGDDEAVEVDGDEIRSDTQAITRPTSRERWQFVETVRFFSSTYDPGSSMT